MPNSQVLLLWLIVFLASLTGLRLQSATPLQIRVGVKELTPIQRTNFVRCVLWLKTHPSSYDTTGSGLNAYDWMVKLHKDGFEAHLAGGSGVHMAPSFFPWHREYLLAFERELQRAARELGIPETVTLPYWDWTDPETAPLVFRDDFLGGNGSGNNAAFTNGLPNTRNSPFRVRSGPFATRDDRTTEFLVSTNAAVSGTSPQGPPRFFLQRAIGTHRIFSPVVGTTPPEYPTAELLDLLPKTNEIAHALQMTLYDLAAWDYTVETNLQFLERTTFRNYMEGHTGLLNVFTEEPFGDQIHGRVHLWMGGNMSSSSSPNDPLFWLHHANLDRIWAEWQDRQGIFNFPAEWTYLNSNSNTVSVVATEVLWGFNKAAGYPNDITSLDTLEIRASGVRYDTQAESAPAQLVAFVSRINDSTRLEVRVAAVRGLQYQMEAAQQADGPWTASGPAVIAEGSELRFERITGSGETTREFLRLRITAAPNQPVVGERVRLLLSGRPSSEPRCGVDPLAKPSTASADRPRRDY
ncbi:MAG: tyrosinase family protein [Verrucomicrobia bacterium]|nr:tyrosinase family protein [Verrucomicrobiota bacterium]